jgi:hypothetical protein
MCTPEAIETLNTPKSSDDLAAKKKPISISIGQ